LIEKDRSKDRRLKAVMIAKTSRIKLEKVGRGKCEKEKEWKTVEIVDKVLY